MIEASLYTLQGDRTRQNERFLRSSGWTPFCLGRALFRGRALFGTLSSTCQRRECDDSEHGQSNCPKPLHIFSLSSHLVPQSPLVINPSGANPLALGVAKT